MVIESLKADCEVRTGRPPGFLGIGSRRLWRPLFRVLYLADVGCLLALPAPGRLVAHPLAFLQGPKPAPGDARVMNEDILAPFVGGYEPVSLLLTEPLHRSLGHLVFAPAFLWWI